MKVKRKCIEDAFKFFENLYPTDEEYEVRICMSQGFSKVVNVPKGSTLNEFIAIYRSQIITGKPYQLIILDKVEGDNLRLSYLQKNQLEVVTVDRTTHKFYTIHEPVHPFIDFLYRNSNFLVNTETWLKRGQETARTSKILLDIESISYFPRSYPELYTDNKSKSLIAKLIRFAERGTEDEDVVYGIPYYKAVGGKSIKYISDLDNWMTDILFVREPDGASHYKITLISEKGEKTFRYKRGSYYYEEVELSSTPSIKSVIHRKRAYLRTKLDVYIFRDCLSKKRPVSKYFEENF